MDISLIQDFKQCLNTKLDNIILSIIEQYNSEISKLEEVIVSSTQMIHEKENLIKDLTDKLDENNFNEENFNKFSIISNLNKQVNELSKKNEVLETSLRVRKNSLEKKANLQMEISNDTNTEEEVVVDNNEEEVVVDNNELEVVDNNEEEVVVDNNEVEVVVDNNEVEVVDNNEEVVEVTEEEIEVEEIEYKDKTYYVKDDIMYNKKKNGDMGKEVGKMVNGKPKLNKKKKKNKE